MATKKTLNIGLIGGGFMGRTHSNGYRRVPNFFPELEYTPVLKAVCFRNETKAKAFAEQWGYESFETDWRKIIARADIDAVDICTPNDTHAEIAIAAAAAGKHIISEKPLARSGEEAKTMYDAVKNAGIVHMVAFNYRRTPAVALAKKYIEEGAIGEILNFRGTYLQDLSADPDGPLSWRFQKSIAGSGSLGDIGTHVVDMARYLCGEITQVNTELKTWVKTRPLQAGGVDKLGASTKDSTAPRGEVDVDDEVLSLLEFQNGAIGSLEATRNAHGRNNFLTFEVHGTLGSVYFNYERRDELQVAFAADQSDRKGFRTVYTGPAHPYGEGLWPIPALGIGYGETKIIETYDFIKAIMEGGEVSPNFKDGYQINLIADAMAASSQSRSWTQVQLVK